VTAYSDDDRAFAAFILAGIILRETGEIGAFGAVLNIGQYRLLALRTPRPQNRYNRSHFASLQAGKGRTNKHVLEKTCSWSTHCSRHDGGDVCPAQRRCAAGQLLWRSFPWRSGYGRFSCCSSWNWNITLLSFQSPPNRVRHRLGAPHCRGEWWPHARYSVCDAHTFHAARGWLWRTVLVRRSQRAQVGWNRDNPQTIPR